VVRDDGCEEIYPIKRDSSAPSYWSLLHIKLRELLNDKSQTGIARLKEWYPIVAAFFTTPLHSAS
jgi:hypothetical protein